VLSVICPHIYDVHVSYIDGGNQLIIETGVIGKPGRRVVSRLRSPFHALATLYRMLRRNIKNGFNEVPDAPSPLPVPVPVA
jgi:hypothetical protein